MDKEFWSHNNIILVEVLVFVEQNILLLVISISAPRLQVVFSLSAPRL